MRNVLGGGSNVNQYPSWEGMSAPQTHSQAGPMGYGGYGDGSPVPAAGEPAPAAGSTQTMTLPAAAVQAGGGGQPPLHPQTLPQGPGRIRRSVSWIDAKARGIPWYVWLALGAGGMYYYQKRKCGCKKAKSVLQDAYEEEVDEDEAEPTRNPKRKGQTAARVVGTALGALARSSLGM